MQFPLTVKIRLRSTRPGSIANHRTAVIIWKLVSNVMSSEQDEVRVHSENTHFMFEDILKKKQFNGSGNKTLLTRTLVNRRDYSKPVVRAAQAQTTKRFRKKSKKKKKQTMCDAVVQTPPTAWQHSATYRYWSSFRYLLLLLLCCNFISFVWSLCACSYGRLLFVNPAHAVMLPGLSSGNSAAVSCKSYEIYLLKDSPSVPHVLNFIQKIFCNINLWKGIYSAMIKWRPQTYDTQISKKKKRKKSQSCVLLQCIKHLSFSSLFHLVGVDVNELSLQLWWQISTSHFWRPRPCWLKCPSTRTCSAETACSRWVSQCEAGRDLQITSSLLLRKPKPTQSNKWAKFSCRWNEAFWMARVCLANKGIRKKLLPNRQLITSLNFCSQEPRALNVGCAVWM